VLRFLSVRRIAKRMPPPRRPREEGTDESSDEASSI
jgi:hypothetical protein